MAFLGSRRAAEEGMSEIPSYRIDRVVIGVVMIVATGIMTSPGLLLLLHRQRLCVNRVLGSFIIIIGRMVEVHVLR